MKRNLHGRRGLFRFISFPLLRGNPRLHYNTWKCVLTERRPKIFVPGNAMAKCSNMRNHALKVTGIARTFRPISSGLCVSYDVKCHHNDGLMFGSTIGCLLCVACAKRQPSLYDNQLPRFMDKYMGSDMKKFGLFYAFIDASEDIYFENADLTM